MDDLVESIVTGIWKFIKFVIYIVIVNIVLFNLGRFTLLIVTAGKYPRYMHLEKDYNKICWVGFILILTAWVTLAIYNNLN
jgi:hypothetical protein